MGEFVAILVIGLSQGAVFSLVGAGATLLLGVTGILNFVHGDFVMIGAMAAVLAAPQLGFWGAAALGILIVVGLAALLYVGLFRLTFDRQLQALILSLGLVLIIETLATDRYSLRPRSIDTPFSGTVPIGGVNVANTYLVALGVSVAACAALYLLLERTWIGNAFRAIGSDRLAARSLGIAEVPVGFAAFLISASLAALAGVLELTLQPISPLLGETALFTGFTVAIIGGLGNVQGAVVGGFLYGVLASVGGRYLNPSYTSAYGYALMLFVLLLRPQGLLIRRAVRSEGA